MERRARVERTHHLGSHIVDKNRTTPEYIIVKFQNFTGKKKISQASSKKIVTSKRSGIRLALDCSSANWKTIMNAFKILKTNKFWWRILEPAKLLIEYK